MCAGDSARGKGCGGRLLRWQELVNVDESLKSLDTEHRWLVKACLVALS